MNYREINKVNQSSLKKILIHPQEYLKAVKKQSEPEVPVPHFMFGDIVDMMICKEYDKIEEKYFVMSSSIKCSDAIIKIVSDIFYEIAETKKPFEPFDSYTSLIIKYRNLNGYDGRLKEETAIAKIISEGTELFNQLSVAKDKLLINESEYNKATIAHASLKADPFIQKYMTPSSKDVEFLDKFIVEFKCNNTELKGELDRVAIFHKEKLIVPIDFKTTGKSVLDFNKDFWSYRYDFQEATYKTGLLLNPKIKELLSKGYRLDTFKYIVVEKESINLPIIFNVPPSVHHIGLHGGMRNGYKYEGLIDAVERLEWHQKYAKWEHKKEYYENQQIDIFI